VARTAQQLAALPAGARVVTFHGFGGELPPGFVRTAVEQVGAGELVLAIRR
jgi:hypothetical protein